MLTIKTVRTITISKTCLYHVILRKGNNEWLLMDYLVTNQFAIDRVKCHQICEADNYVVKIFVSFSLFQLFIIFFFLIVIKPLDWNIFPTPFNKTCRYASQSSEVDLLISLTSPNDWLISSLEIFLKNYLISIPRHAALS